MTAAASCEETPAGTGTHCAAGASASSAHAPATAALATRSPTRNSVTPDPIAVTTPAAS